ncbi:MAG: hypothetical protein ACRD1T_27425, partial [Acidimicrobiia bacterium]
AQQAQVEHQYLSDDEFFERMAAVEDELVDAYVRDELSPSERQHFERRLSLVPSWQRKVEFSRTLMRSMSQSRPAPSTMPESREGLRWWPIRRTLGVQRPVLAWSLALAASIIVFVGSSWLLFETGRLRNEVDQLRAERAELRRREGSLQAQIDQQRQLSDQYRNELQRHVNREDRPGAERPKRQPIALATFMLSPGLLRDVGESNTIAVPPGTETVQLRMSVGRDEYLFYRAVLSKPEGHELWRDDRLKAGATPTGQMVTLAVPAGLLTPGDYILTLSGVDAEERLENIDDYSFRVVRR